MRYNFTILIGILLLGMKVSFGQYHLGLYTECNQDPLVILNCPESNNFLNKHLIIDESIGMVISCTYDTVESKSEERRILKYTETDFTKSGLVKSHFYLDSLWAKKCFKKKKWKLVIARTQYYYSTESQLDSIYRIYLDNHPKKRKDDYLWEVACINGVNSFDSFTELTNRKFYELAENYTKNIEFDLEYSSAVSIYTNDTLNEQDLILLNGYYHHVNDKGLITSIWRMRKDKLELYSVFIYKNNN